MLPDAYPAGRRDDDRHGLTLAARASLDHVNPHSAGGGSDDDNLVTACWSCQFGRGNDTIERLDLSDPRQRPPIDVLPRWDGCEWFH